MNRVMSTLIGLNFLILAGCSTNVPVSDNTVGSVKKGGRNSIS